MSSEMEPKPLTLIASVVEGGLKIGMHNLHPELFPEDWLIRLRALSVTTAEEFIGITAADLQATADFLGLTIEDAENLKTCVLETLPDNVRNKLTKPINETNYRLGALNPEDLN